MEPAIKNWRNFPPPGGWGIDYKLEGQVFHFSGSPKKIVDQVRKVQQANGIYESDDLIWRMLNAIWCERAPEKCIRSMLAQRSAAKSTLFKSKAPAKARRSGGGCGGCGGGRMR